MLTYQSTQVYSYITHLEKYLKGDLDQFHKICIEIEKLESGLTGSSSTSGPGRTFETSSLSSTTTTETTILPGGSGISPIEPVPEKIYFRSTIPHTLTLFSTVDVLGFLSGSNNNPLKTYLNFQEFFKFSDIPVSDLEVKVLNLVFRQGLVHVYFPKLNVGISYHSSNPKDKLFIKKSTGLIILNVNCLEEIVVKTLETIKDKPELYSEMDRKYNEMVTDYETNQRGLISLLDLTL